MPRDGGSLLQLRPMLYRLDGDDHSDDGDDGNDSSDDGDDNTDYGDDDHYIVKRQYFTISNLVRILISLSVLWQYVWCSKGLIFLMATFFKTKSMKCSPTLNQP